MLRDSIVALLFFLITNVVALAAGQFDYLISQTPMDHSLMKRGQVSSLAEHAYFLAHSIIGEEIEVVPEVPDINLTIQALARDFDSRMARLRPSHPTRETFHFFPLLFRHLIETPRFEAYRVIFDPRLLNSEQVASGDFSHLRRLARKVVIEDDTKLRAHYIDQFLTISEWNYEALLIAIKGSLADSGITRQSIEARIYSALVSIFSSDFPREQRLHRYINTKALTFPQFKDLLQQLQSISPSLVTSLYRYYVNHPFAEQFEPLFKKKTLNDFRNRRYKKGGLIDLKEEAAFLETYYPLVGLRQWMQKALPCQQLERL